ncbi:GNAT family N-acetyltransferase [Novosphingobium sp. EMRT-2]|uniref:GNAT family N-acetyltransferase n=1 Tax=Novosphingobium sp. EMRT-2 TaxID=2571749 RepID=UPI0010BD6A79|nr:GNAT family N-acetyltransferase [Novosphingobium sp. EMRT-2]QCI92757.1 GNAT family N-acetyltransferase [Novosphingobium sp. EMRT-2]
MTAHPLDRPVWNSLRGRLSALASGDDGVVRIDPRYGPFAACAPGRTGALVGVLGEAGEEIWLVEPELVEPPAGMVVLRTGPVLQMVADDPLPEVGNDDGIAMLGENDAGEMAAIASATAPGPWSTLTHRYGTYYGIRREGRLIAMAGERFKPADGFAELSGVCTYPEFRGQGLARRLILRVMAGFAARGETPFLHAYAANAGAIALYETLGYRARRELVVTVLGKAA